MTDTVLARLRVRETHGIRRFLYPLHAHLDLPASRLVGAGRSRLCLTADDGTALPWQLTAGEGQAALEFAVSLAPFETQTVTLTEGDASPPLADPLQVTAAEGGLRNQQKQFAVTVTHGGAIADVVYDGVAHLRGPSGITRNGEAAQGKAVAASFGDYALLNAHLFAQRRYVDGCGCRTDVRITAVKSWAMVTHTLDTPQPQDEVVFTLPLRLTSDAPTCDFGVGGGIYGKLQAGTADEVVWRTEFGKSAVEWSVGTDGRTDYAGRVDTAEAYHAQQWLHVIDGGKALAVAVVQVPDACRTMIVTLRAGGDVQVAFTLGETVSGPAKFGVCWHFLNNVPAIAAATSPQSILLPPCVDVLDA